MANRAAIRPRAIFSRKTIAPPVVEADQMQGVLAGIDANGLCGCSGCLMGHSNVLLVLLSPAHSLSGSGREHGRSIPFLEVGVHRSRRDNVDFFAAEERTNRCLAAGSRQGDLLCLFSPAVYCAANLSNNLPVALVQFREEGR